MHTRIQNIYAEFITAAEDKGTEIRGNDNGKRKRHERETWEWRGTKEGHAQNFK